MATVNVNAARRKGWFSDIDRALSNVTYEVYLFHSVVLMVVEKYTSHDGHFKQLPFVLVAYAIVLALSWGVYVWFDRPIDERRRRFVKGAARSKEIAAVWRKQDY
jgi:peptidoglycan/LPS O-acetylase OafA/YrhL